ncbi:MAG: metal-dependent transcriptional regulator [Chitinophagales bacterium]
MTIKVSETEENYLKAIYKIAEKLNTVSFVNTNAIAEKMQTKAASVTDMLKRLSEKNLVSYQKYKGVQLTKDGTFIAKKLIRKHRLWEVFLVEKLDFKWDEVHEIAEKMEHIPSDELTNRLDAFLDYPKYDPHGDPIPDENGNWHVQSQIYLTQLPLNETAIIVGVAEHNAEFLHYLEQQNLLLGTQISILKKFKYDESLQILMPQKKKTIISKQVSKKLLVKKVDSE